MSTERPTNEAADELETEGHVTRGPAIDPEGADDTTEGNLVRNRLEDADGDDQATQGHPGMRFHVQPAGNPDPDADTEGHVIRVK